MLEKILFLLNVHLKNYKLRLLDGVKRSSINHTFILSSLVLTCVDLLIFFKSYQAAFFLLSPLFRSNWKNSLNGVSLRVSKMMKNEERFQRFVHSHFEKELGDIGLKRFAENPQDLFGYMLIIVRKPTEQRKGIIILKYSAYFAIFAAKFDVKELLNEYELILEPSWAGYADMAILCFCTIKAPVYVMVYEEKDLLFVKSIASNLRPIEIGPSWWVDMETFYPREIEKEYDIVMVSSWSYFKNHFRLFKALKRLSKKGVNLKLCAVGYRGDFGYQNILKLSRFMGLDDNITFFDKVPQAKVAELMAKSKINILWSSFEGNNRSIIEGFWCNVPCLMKEGHNWGEKYRYINSKTGTFCTDQDLEQNIVFMLENCDSFAPFTYVENHHNYIEATKIILYQVDGYISDSSLDNIYFKINKLLGMEYIKADAMEELARYYERLLNIYKL